ncbi:MAG: arginine--tRNA ligase [Actinobacteria bacterium]|nr:arginine--tRNA ligase [Actinomycetota bacterium]NBY15008.1 arginine--tRNA ligase [Actinomycetota bacterium]
MTPQDLAKHIKAAVLSAISSGQLALDLTEVPSQIVVDRPKNPEHGDWSTNIAMQLGGKANSNPRAVAEILSPLLLQIDGVTKVDIAGPGFLNIQLSSASQGELAVTVLAQREKFGQGELFAGRKINIEFISANPTGPLHLGHTRWAAVGDAIARVLRAQGAEVVREFYINDRGVQMDKFGASVQARALGNPVPEDGYHGAYIDDLAKQILQEQPEILKLNGDEQLVAFREAAYKLQLAQQQSVLAGFNTNFNVWYSERSLHESDAVSRGFDQLRSQGHVFEHDGATWLRTTDFDDDKDRVLIKADGELTYFASDTAYYVDKRNRGFDLCIYLLGADHHGYVNRLRAVAACAGDNPDLNIEVLIGQMVKMMKDGEEVRLSKRAGNIITLEDLVEEVGVDAARYSLIRYPVDSPLTLDLDLLIQRTNDNPVYYVQYAHARIASVLRNAAELGIIGADPSLWNSADFDPSLLTHEREGQLLGLLADYPRVVTSAGELREPHRIARHLEEVATGYHRFYDACRVLPQGDEPATELTIARLWLCAAARQVIANGLDLLGVSAPQRM